MDRAFDQLDTGGMELLVIENVGNLVCPTAFDLGESAAAGAAIGHGRGRQAAQVPGPVPVGRCGGDQQESTWRTPWTSIAPRHREHCRGGAPGGAVRALGPQRRRPRPADALAETPTPGSAGVIRRLRLEIEGLVQGVGFRPQVARLAGAGSLRAGVQHRAGVQLELEGPADAIATQLQGLQPLLGPPPPRPDPRPPEIHWGRGTRARMPGGPAGGGPCRQSERWPCAGPDRAGSGPLRGLPSGAARPQQPPPWLPLHQLLPVRARATA